MTTEQRKRYRAHTEEKRTERIFIRVSPREKKIIQEQAGDQSVGAYLVGLAIGADDGSGEEASNLA